MKILAQVIGYDTPNVTKSVRFRKLCGETEQMVEYLLNEGGLEEIERCEHGNIDRHYLYTATDKLDAVWCEGAELDKEEQDE